MKSPPIPSILTPPDVARHLGVDADKVRGWISRGELVAVNVATTLGGRPRWRIRTEDLEAFLLRRQSQSPAVRPSRRRAKKSQLIEFF